MSHFPPRAHHTFVTGTEAATIESDADLVQRTRRGERDAFGRLVERYEPAALAAAGSILRSWHDARDAVQDAFVIAFARLNRLWSPRKFGAWLLRIVRRQALLYLRRRATLSRRLTPLIEEPPAPPPPDEVKYPDALALIARLPEAECVVITLRHIQDLSVAQIAAVTGRPLGTVTKQLSRAHARMRAWIENQD